MSDTMEKQHNLLKLIVQKMEISSEEEEHDGPPVFQELKEKLLTRSKWGPLLRAVTARKKGVCKFMKRHEQAIVLTELLYLLKLWWCG